MSEKELNKIIVNGKERKYTFSKSLSYFQKYFVDEICRLLVFLKEDNYSFLRSKIVKVQEKCEQLQKQ